MGAVAPVLDRDDGVAHDRRNVAIGQPRIIWPRSSRRIRVE
jgi:hypothetical protein